MTHNRRPILCQPENINFPKDWQYFSFHRYVQRGVFDVDWGGEKLVFDSLIGTE